MNLSDMAFALLQESERYLEDARKGAPVGNSVVGSLLAIQTGSPRQYTEQAVCEAVERIDREAAKPQPDGDEYTLTRTGKAPLKFRGELIAENDGQRQGGKDHTRWHELGIYRSIGGKYVLHIAYRTQWQGEQQTDLATVLDSPDAVSNTLGEYDPCAHLMGYPAGDAYAERQRRLEADLRLRYETQVSELLGSDEFAEVVE